MVKKYHKLVRDRIPQIIRAQGKDCTTCVLDEANYLQMLEEKLQEELTEYRESKAPEELADLLEVMMAVAAATGHAWQEIEDIRLKKREKRGGFEDRIALLEVSDSL